MKFSALALLLLFASAHRVMALENEVILRDNAALALIKNLNGPHVSVTTERETVVKLGVNNESGRWIEYELSCNSETKTCRISSWDTD